MAGDVLDDDALAKAMVGQDAVVVTLGISDNPLTVLLLRRASTPLDVRSRGTAKVIDAMRAAGVRRLIVQSTYGIGETYRKLPLSLKFFLSLVIRPQVADHVRQEALVRGSGLDWTVVRPVVLHDVATDAPAQVDLDDQVASMKVSRDQLARVLADAVDRDDWHGPDGQRVGLRPALRRTFPARPSPSLRPLLAFAADTAAANARKGREGGGRGQARSAEQGLTDVLAGGDARRDGEQRRAGVLEVLAQAVVRARAWSASG